MPEDRNIGRPHPRGLLTCIPQDVKDVVLPELLRKRDPRGAIRVWAPDSTGEEVYSLAISVIEMTGSTAPVPLRIFGTSISDRAVKESRAGVYDADAVRQVSESSLVRFFVPDERRRAYKINALLRHSCFFARHDLAVDPPFSRLDLLYCGSDLTRVERLPRRILGAFQWALKDTGFLVLAAPDSAGTLSDYFESLNSRRTVFARKPATVASGGDLTRLVSQRSKLWWSLMEKDPAEGTREHDPDDQAAMSADLVTMNEELLASNEALRATQEELESAYRTLLSANTELNVDLKNVLSGLNIPLLVLDAAGNIRHITESARRVLRLRPWDIGRPVAEMRLLEGLSGLDLQSSISKVADRDKEKELELEVRGDGGRWYSVRVSFCAAEGEKIDRVLVALVDVTDLKRAQEEKLDSAGALAAGIAHDFNNLLSGMLAEAELVEGEMPAGSAGLEEIQKIKGLARRASEIARQMMVYAGRDTMDFELVDISRLVDEMLELLHVSVPKGATINAELDSNAPPVRGHASQIRQVVMNLVINASEALGGRAGVIRVATSRVKRNNLLPGNGAVSHGRDYVQLTVSDNGRGMTDGEMRRAFDPFFTTKFMGRGLGLAVVQGMVRSHGGTVNVASAPGRGTTFEIFLPSAGERETTGETVAAPAASVERPGLPGSVLIAEDEELLRRALSKMLRMVGCSVVEAGNGSAAIELVRAAEQPIDVILLDLTMPGATAREVLDEVHRNRPTVKVVLMSAYSAEGAPPSPQVAGFIRKPFSARELTDLVVKTIAASRLIGAS
jgi:signal transduction histidine kinase